MQILEITGARKGSWELAKCGSSWLYYYWCAALTHPRHVPEMSHGGGTAHISSASHRTYVYGTERKLLLNVFHVLLMSWKILEHHLRILPRNRLEVPWTSGSSRVGTLQVHSSDQTASRPIRTNRTSWWRLSCVCLPRRHASANSHSVGQMTRRTWRLLNGPKGLTRAVEEIYLSWLLHWVLYNQCKSVTSHPVSLQRVPEMRKHSD